MIIKNESKLSDKTKRANSYSKNIFKTEHLKENLKVATIRGGAATFISQGIKFIINTFSTLVLARLLTPSDFGLIGMVSVFTGFVLLFKDLGLSVATIQSDKISVEQVSTLFWVNFTFSIILSLIGIALAPFITWFYKEPKLMGITIVSSLTFIFGGLSAQHAALLKRQMQFTTLAIIDVVSILIGIIVGITMAFFNMGYWSLVMLSASQNLTSMILYWYFVKWIPNFPSKNAGVYAMLKFGRNLTGYNILNYLSRNADYFIIGKWLGSEELGIYNRAYHLLLLPINQIASPIGNIAIPALSRVNDNPKRYLSVFSQFQSKITLLTMPFMIFLLIAGDNVVFLVLGEQWKAAIPVFRWLGLVGISQAALVSSGWVFITQGRTKEMFLWGFIGSLLSVASFVVGLPWGIKGIAASYAISGLLIRTPITVFWLTKSGNLDFKTFLSSNLPAVKLSTVVFVLCLIVKMLYPYPSILNTIIILFSVTCSYFLSLLFADVRKNVLEIYSQLKLLRKED